MSSHFEEILYSLECLKSYEAQSLIAEMLSEFPKLKILIPYGHWIIALQIEYITFPLYYVGQFEGIPFSMDDLDRQCRSLSGMLTPPQGMFSDRNGKERSTFFAIVNEAIKERKNIETKSKPPVILEGF